MVEVTNKAIMDKLEFIEEMVMAIIEHFNVPRNTKASQEKAMDDPPAEKMSESKITLIADSEGYVNHEYLKKTGTKL